MPVKVVASVAGQVISMQHALGNIVRLRTRCLFECIATRASWRAPVKVSPKAWAELKFWRSQVKSLKSLNAAGGSFKLSTCYDVSTYCDASGSG